jgi:hypothetical protein
MTGNAEPRQTVLIEPWLGRKAGGRSGREPGQGQSQKNSA